MKKLPNCLGCIHFFKGRFNKKGSFAPVFKCRAFLKEIPKDIIDSEFIHDKKHPDQDNNIIFEEME